MINVEIRRADDVRGVSGFMMALLLPSRTTGDLVAVMSQLLAWPGWGAEDVGLYPGAESRKMIPFPLPLMCRAGVSRGRQRGQAKKPRFGRSFSAACTMPRDWATASFASSTSEAAVPAVGYSSSLRRRRR